ncbi:MAG: toprim domain-containing protein [Immundisolibacteraceae bacterium]|nr:toprim domain-containing protein [Immundisolibacteraceae bacterium]
MDSSYQNTPEQIEQIINLIQANLYGEKSYKNQTFYNDLICPNCSKQKAYIKIDSPFAFNCNSCKEPQIVYDVFPSLKVKKEPNITPESYLQNRGIKKCLAQINYEIFQGIGIQFNLPNGKYNTRIFNPKEGFKNKTLNSKGSMQGVYWKLKNPLEPNKPLYITEGIFDALSFCENDYQAISILSSSSKASHYKESLKDFKEIILAFDNDESGKKAFLDWSNTFKNATSITCPKGKDWNDLQKSNKLESLLNKSMSDLRINADLLTENNPKKYINSIAQNKMKDLKNFFPYELDHTSIPKIFVFNGIYYSTKKNNKKDSKESSTPYYNVTPISNFILNVHCIYDNEIIKNVSYLKEYKVEIKIKEDKKGKKNSTTFILNPNDIETEQKFKNCINTHTVATWQGGKYESEALFHQIKKLSDITVKRTQEIGQYKDDDIFVFDKFLIEPNGDLISLEDKGDYFKRSDFCIQPPNVNYRCIKPTEGKTPKEIFKLIHQTWGNKGLFLCAWTVASWFNRDIKKEAKIGFFPFASMIGEASTGKSTLSKILNAIQCINEEGLAMTSTNTKNGLDRVLGGRSNLFQAVLEAQTIKDLGGLESLMLTLYNNEQVGGTKATKDYTNNTLSRSIKSSILFIQNNDVFKKDRQKQRVISFRLSQKDHTDESKKTIQELKDLLSEDIGQFSNIFKILVRHRKDIKKSIYEEYKKIDDDFRDNLDNEILERIRNNYALIFTFIGFIDKYLKCSLIKDYKLKEYTLSQIESRDQQCSQSEEDEVLIHFISSLESYIQNIKNGSESILKRNEKIFTEDNTLYINFDNLFNSMVLSNKALSRLNPTQILRLLREHKALIPDYKNSKISYTKQLRVNNQRFRFYMFNLNDPLFDEIKEITYPNE